MDSVSAFEAGGCGFESRRGYCFLLPISCSVNRIWSFCCRFFSVNRTLRARKKHTGKSAILGSGNCSRQYNTRQPHGKHSRRIVPQINQLVSRVLVVQSTFNIARYRVVYLPYIFTVCVQKTFKTKRGQHSWFIERRPPWGSNPRPLA